MKKEEAGYIIAERLLLNSINNKISLLENYTALLRAVKYDNKTFNDSYGSDFDEYREILQNLVYSFGFNACKVNGWKHLTLENYEETAKENIATLKSMKKAMKFIS